MRIFVALFKVLKIEVMGPTCSINLKQYHDLWGRSVSWTKKGFCYSFRIIADTVVFNLSKFILINAHRYCRIVFWSCSLYFEKLLWKYDCLQTSQDNETRLEDVRNFIMRGRKREYVTPYYMHLLHALTLQVFEKNQLNIGRHNYWRKYKCWNDPLKRNNKEKKITHWIFPKKTTQCIYCENWWFSAHT